MDEGLRRSIARTRVALRAVLVCAAVLASLLAARASAEGMPVGGSSASQGNPQTTATVTGGVSATLEECVTAVAQSERAATFSGEMTAIPGTVRMSIRIDVEERAPGEAGFHAVTYPGLGVWRSADPKVKTYKYLKQVTNLSSPASYRGFVQFRWTGDKGRTIKRAERMTLRCSQPALPGEPAQSSSEGASGSSSSGALVPPKG
jgi:hypothetical protein